MIIFCLLRNTAYKGFFFFFFKSIYITFIYLHNKCLLYLFVIPIAVTVCMITAPMGNSKTSSRGDSPSHSVQGCAVSQLEWSSQSLRSHGVWRESPSTLLLQLHSKVLPASWKCNMLYIYFKQILKLHNILAILLIISILF